MGKPVRWTLKTLCGIFGYEAFRRVNDKELSTLFGMLCPFDTGIPLVRIGANSDGGYLIPDDFDGVQACLSPGVAETASFEIALEKRGIPSLLTDASVSGPPLGAEHMRFEKKFVGLQNTDLFKSLDMQDDVLTFDSETDDEDLKRQLAAVIDLIRETKKNIAALDKFWLSALTNKGLNLAKNKFKFIKTADDMDKEADKVTRKYYNDLYDDSEGSPNYGDILEHPEDYHHTLTTEASQKPKSQRFKKV